MLIAAGAGKSKAVDLELKDLASGDIKTVAGAEMTEENRRVIYSKYRS